MLNSSAPYTIYTGAAEVGNGNDSDASGDSPNRGYNWYVLCLFTIVVLAIGGNVLVCLAVKVERKLQNMFNFFLVSLALSDMLSATFVMPLSITKLLIDHLPVPKLMCVAWYSLDVLFTSSTIIHLCMISIDRYMSFKYPLKYGHAKKTKHTILKICLVWIISFCIAGPLFLFSMFDTQKDYAYYKGCGPETTTFVISATVSSFYLPLLIMTIMYILTVRALHSQRVTQRKLAITNHSVSSSYSLRDESSYNLHKKLSPRSSTIIPPSTPVPGRSPAAGRRPFGPTLSVQSDSDRPENGYSEARYSDGAGRSPLLERRHSARSPDTSPTANDSRTIPNRAFLSPESADLRGLSPSSTCTDINIALQEIDNTCTETHTVPNHQQVNSVKRLKLRTFKLRRNCSANSSRRGADKGRRAVQVLGILFAVFVICYLPFFATYVINGTCMQCRPYISPRMITAFEWVAYSGSMLNPIIYHIFNPDFRRTFHKLLRCKCSTV